MKHCIYDYANGPLKYPLIAVFLMDFYLNWENNQAILRGDPSTNISKGLSLLSGKTGTVLHFFKANGRRLARILRSFYRRLTAINPRLGSRYRIAKPPTREV